MFESAELGHAVDDRRYAKEVDALRSELLDAQYELLADRSFPVVVLVNGVDGAGKGETVNLLNEWLDPRHVATHAFGEPTEAERLRPRIWRYWQALPPKGKIGVLFGSWYSSPIVGRVTHALGANALAADLDRIRTLEQMLVDDGTLLVKLWFHLSKKAQKKRLTALEEDKLTRWHVSDQDWKNFRQYDRYRKVSEHVLRETSTGPAPWLVIDGSDPNYRALTVGKALLAAIRQRLGTARRSANGKTNGRKNGARASAAAAPARRAHRIASRALSADPREPAGALTEMLSTVDTSSILTDLPFKERLSKEKYEVKIVKTYAKLGRFSRSPKMKKHAVVAVFEGMDAAGKGGAIRRITQAVDARQYSVIPIAAPTNEERAHPYLWRFWRHIPRLGRFAIFDRSWYGRVLVERVEGFATEPAWSRAYHEINEFEEQLADHGIVIVKFWLAITKDEQMKRFKERETTSYKQFKITAEDWRNRKKWDDYVTAASDMIDRTSTSFAPWTVVEANDKHLARVRVVETLNERLAAAL